MHISSPTHRENNKSSRSGNGIGDCQMAWPRGFDMFAKKVVTTLHDTAHGAAHPYTEVSKDVSCHTPFLECLVAAVPCTSCNGAVRTSNTVST